MTVKRLGLQGITDDVYEIAELLYKQLRALFDVDITTLDATTATITTGTITTGTITTGTITDLTAGTAAVSDLTEDRLVIAGASGELEDDTNLTWDGSTLTVGGEVSATTFVAGSAKVSDLTNNRLVIVGTSGELEDDANLQFDGSTMIVDATLSATILSTTSINVTDLTDNRVVIAGTSGELEDDANLTWDGSTLTVGGEIDVTDITINTPSNIYALSHDSFADFVANEHIDHTSVTLTAGNGLSGGGDISANRSFAVDLNELTVETAIAAGDYLAMVDVTDNGSGKITFANLEGTIDHGNLAGLDTGADHSYIDQDVTTSGSPTFAGLTSTSTLEIDTDAGFGIQISQNSVSGSYGYSGLLLQPETEDTNYPGFYTHLRLPGTTESDRVCGLFFEDGDGTDLGLIYHLPTSGIFVMRNYGAGNIRFENSAFDITFQVDTDGDVTIGYGKAGHDLTLTFDGESNDGVLEWLEDEDGFNFQDTVKFSGSKIGFYSTTPITQPATVSDPTTQTLTGTDRVNRSNLESWMNSQDTAIATIIDRLQALGLIA